jgi:hypothetical protein
VPPNVADIFSALRKSEFTSSPITGTLASIFLITSVGFLDAWWLRKKIVDDWVSLWGTILFAAANGISAAFFLYMSNFRQSGFEHLPDFANIVIWLWAALSITLIGECWIEIESRRWKNDPDEE